MIYTLYDSHDNPYSRLCHYNLMSNEFDESSQNWVKDGETYSDDADFMDVMMSL